MHSVSSVRTQIHQVLVQVPSLCSMLLTGKLSSVPWAVGSQRTHSNLTTHTQNPSTHTHWRVSSSRMSVSWTVTIPFRFQLYFESLLITCNSQGFIFSLSRVPTGAYVLIIAGAFVCLNDCVVCACVCNSSLLDNLYGLIKIVFHFMKQFSISAIMFSFQPLVFHSLHMNECMRGLKKEKEILV